MDASDRIYLKSENEHIREINSNHSIHEINHYTKIFISENLFVCFTRNYLSCGSCRKQITKFEDLFSPEINCDTINEKSYIAYCGECSTMDSFFTSKNMEFQKFPDLLKDLNFKIENFLFNHEQFKKSKCELLIRKFDEIIQNLKQKFEKILVENNDNLNSQILNINRIKSVKYLLTNIPINPEMPIDYHVYQEILSLNRKIAQANNNTNLFKEKEIALEKDLDNFNIYNVSCLLLETLLESLKAINDFKEIKTQIENSLVNKKMTKSNHKLSLINKETARSLKNSYDKTDQYINYTNLEDSIVENFKELKLLEKQAGATELSQFNLNQDEKPRDQENLIIEDNIFNDNLEANIINHAIHDHHPISFSMTVDNKDNHNNYDLEITGNSTSYFSRPVKEIEKSQVNNLESYFLFNEQKKKLNQKSEVIFQNKKHKNLNESTHQEKSNRKSKPFNEERSYIPCKSINYPSKKSSRSIGSLDNTILIFKIPNKIGSTNNCSNSLRKYFTAVKVLNVVIDNKYPDKYFYAKLYLDCDEINEYYLCLPDIIEVNVNNFKLKIEKDFYSSPFPFLFVSKVYKI